MQKYFAIRLEQRPALPSGPDLHWCANRQAAPSERNTQNVSYNVPTLRGPDKIFS